MKYSNHAYGLVGLVIEAVTGERYGNWVTRNILLTLGLDETLPDAPFPDGAPVARGHSAELPLGRRVIIPGDNPTNALAPATGFISTAADLARFFATLDPDAESSLLRPESRRTMLKRQWASPNSADEAHYGLGLCLGAVRDWPWAGHGGGFQSAKTFTAMLPGRSLCLSVLTNANDGLGEKWSSGLIHILKTFADSPAADARSRSWRGRWWRFGTAIDLVPFADRVLILSPDQMDPFGTPDEITVTGRDTGVVSRSDGYGMQGESARLVRGRNGRVQEVWLGGDRWIPEQRMAVEMLRKYDRRPAAKSGSGTALAR
jgi:CubicO group peptidase (beta-lactamase class C family)